MESLSITSILYLQDFFGIFPHFKPLLPEGTYKNQKNFKIYLIIIRNS